MRQIGLIFLAQFVFSHALFSFDFSLIEDNNLSQDKSWYRLLHYKDGESEIDDKRFFLSKNGKTDPKDELKKTIELLIKDKSDDDNSTFCRFPARANWIIKKLPSLQNEIYQPKCKLLHDSLKSLRAKSLTLVFPTAHINSPASMFGHTFLRIDSDDNMPLTSYAINYAAQTDETSGLIYTYYGLFGGYEGRYSMMEYYKKIKEYSDLEQRDIWEYKLKLSQDEIQKLLLHLFELKDIYADYFFFTENCSYNLLWLLEVAKESVSLTDDFNYKAIPIDTIRAIEKANLIESANYRPSKAKKIKKIISMIENKPAAIKFANTKYDFDYLSKLPKIQQIYTLELAIEQLRIKRANEQIGTKKYTKMLLKLLNLRSKLGKVPAYIIKKPKDPLVGHKTSKFTFSYLSDKSIEFGYKPAFHDLYDLQKGFVSGAYINFFDLVLKYSHNNKIKFSKFDIVNIKSYAKRDVLFKPLSWGIEFGFERFLDNRINFKLKGSIGFSFGNESEYYYYFMLSPSVYYHTRGVFGITPQIGFVKNYDKFKFGISTWSNFYDNGIKNNNFETFITYGLKDNLAINLKYNTIDTDDRLGISLYYYF